MTLSGPSEERQLEEKVISVIARLGASTAAEIGRYIRNVSSPEVEEICRRLVRSDVLLMHDVTKRKTNRYGIVKV